MKKFLGLIFIVIIIIIIAKGCASCQSKEESRKIIEAGQRLETTTDEKQEEIEELEQQVKKYKAKIDLLEQGLDRDIDSAEYLNLKFPSDGNFYKEAYDEITFYTDPTCTIELETEATFMSPEIDTVEAENGLAIYCLRLYNNEICYCPQNKGQPYLITEEKYNELKAENN